MIDGLYVETRSKDPAFLLVRSGSGWYCSSLFRPGPDNETVEILLEKRRGWPIDIRRDNISLVAPEELLTW